MNIEICIAVEGAETRDGRFIVDGALSWEEQMVLVRREVENENPTGQWDRYQMLTIGNVERVWRDGHLVMAEIALDEGHGLTGVVGVCMDIDRVTLTSDEEIYTTGDRMAVTSGRLRAVTLHQDSNDAVWPECVFDIPEGGA